ncbi:TetR/AcrR family transcriptional regulator [Alicyclobacillus sp. ALC3]|uniref:TetR/AcrR family transcriptional regulator n=1 Tax=Alicyclobacillus sp. ALC3 TaxID=2796143 RepID=UPI00237995FD|nr:TetR/AcrR family transcriptional regulator [Alicyclobacillus sp. ALC3]WDL95688.1 TetR/AcrR family transcriptional regulator [Alicyclobacillus sp. ALC3]
MPEVREHRKPGRPPLSSVSVPTPDRILDAAAKLFSESGYDGVSMEQVADDCDVTKAVVYYHFQSKANLFTMTMIRLMETIRQRTLEILTREDSLYERLLLIAKIRLRIDTPLDFINIMRGGLTGITEEQIQSMREAEERLFQTLAQSFETSTATGEIRKVDPALAARVYMALLMVGMNEHTSASGERPDSDQRAEQLLEMMWVGVGLQK